MRTPSKVRRTAHQRLRAIVMTLGLVLGSLTGIVLTSSPAAAADGNILPPFSLGETWSVCEGYNHGTHTGTSAYGLDLVKNNSGSCDNSSSGATVKAPVSGTVYYYQASYGNLCVNIAGGRSYTLTHITSSITSGSVTAGQTVGSVGAAGMYNNNGVAHIHFQMWSASNCYNSSVMPFDSADSARICGAPDLTSSGPSGGNGTWSGRSFVGQACGVSTPPLDTDADGVPDGADVCKNQPGVDYLNGCVQQQAKMNGDFNGDGNADVAAFYRYPERGNAVGLFVWLGNGDGTFGSPQLGWYASTGWDGLHVIVAGAGDFNGDGRSDVAAFYRYDNTTIRLFTWSGQADGTFTSPIVGNVQSAFEGANVTPIGVGDFNGDGTLDVEVFYRYPERGNAMSLYMFSGNGDGTFGDALLSRYDASGWEGLHLISAGAGDFNGDGKADVVAFYEYPDTSIKMFEWLGTSTGTFASSTVVYTGSGWEGYNLIPIGVGDFDGNGKLDVAAFYRYPERGNAVGLFVWYGNGNGTFGSPELPWYTATGWEGTHVISAGVGDYDHNGQSDVTAFYEYPDTSIKMFEWHNEHWGTFPSTDPAIRFTGAGWEGFHLMA